MGFKVYLIPLNTNGFTVSNSTLKLLFHGTFQMQPFLASQVYSKVIASTESILGTAIMFLGNFWINFSVHLLYDLAWHVPK